MENYNISEKKALDKPFLMRIYRDCGYNVIPINEKAPPCVSFKQWETERVTPELLVEWSGRRFGKKAGGRWILDEASCLNWAILTGLKPYSDSPALVVVDSDDAAAEAKAAELCPPTPAMTRTASGTWHRVYRRPPASQIAYLPNRAGTRINGVKYKIDIRADHGYFMMPGSWTTKRKRFYEWKTPWTLKMLNALPVYSPLWLNHEDRRTATSSKAGSNTIDVYESVAEIEVHEEAVEFLSLPMEIRVDQARNYLAHCPGSEEGRGASNYCFALSMTVCWGFLLGTDEAVEVLHEWGQKDSNKTAAGRHYPWTYSQIEHKVDNAIHTKYEGSSGDKLNRFHLLEEQLEEILLKKGRV
jgi:hypothetical protein